MLFEPRAREVLEIRMARVPSIGNCTDPWDRQASSTLRSRHSVARQCDASRRRGCLDPRHRVAV
eukprot:2389608-Lingulodinium_polyedra.AAC.1